MSSGGGKDNSLLNTFFKVVFKADKASWKGTKSKKNSSALEPIDSLKK